MQTTMDRLGSLKLYVSQNQLQNTTNNNGWLHVSANVVVLTCVGFPATIMGHNLRRNRFDMCVSGDAYRQQVRKAGRSM